MVLLGKTGGVAISRSYFVLWPKFFNDFPSEVRKVETEEVFVFLRAIGSTIEIHKVFIHY